jgi:hypothetical protein
MRFSLKLAQSTQPGERHHKFSTDRQKFGSRGPFLGKNAHPFLGEQSGIFRRKSTA